MSIFARMKNSALSRGQAGPRWRGKGGRRPVALALGLMTALAGCTIEALRIEQAYERAMPVTVDGTTYSLRRVLAEPFMMAHVAPLTPDGRTGPSIRIGDTPDGERAAHVLNAYCRAEEGYSTARARARGDVLYGDFGDFVWRDPATGEWVFPMEDCRS